MSEDGCLDASAGGNNSLSDGPLLHQVLLDWLAAGLDHEPWVYSTVASVLVGLSGVLPLLVIPLDETASLKQGAKAKTLRVLLSFAVGGLLGDVFLHLLPEAWENEMKSGQHHAGFKSGSLVLIGMVLFIAAEQIFGSMVKAAEESIHVPPVEKVNNNTKGLSANHVEAKQLKKRKVAGYLNLIANSVDNFTHGLAVGGSFLISQRIGWLTTCAILVHEIPHEVGDFAILLRSGFSRWDAALGQLITATAGLIGSFVAVTCSGVASKLEAKTSWILPFTAGGFLHIALVSVLPELLKEDDARESMKQLFALLTGIFVMAYLTVIVEG